MSQRGSMAPFVSAVAAVFVLHPAAQAGTIVSGGVTLSYRQDVARGLVLESVGDALEPAAFTLPDADLWELELREVATGDVVRITPSESAFDFAIVERPSDLVATWSDVQSDLLPEAETFTVVVRARALDDEPIVTLEVEVTTSTASFSLYAIRFPRVDVLSRGTPASQVLTFPYVGGWLLPDPIHNPAVTSGLGIPFVHPGSLSMQWMAYYDSSEADPALVFLGTRDATGHYKETILGRVAGDDGTPNGMSFTLRQVPEDNLAADGDYSSAFSFVIGVLRGDWYDAARFYRSWATKQPWAAKGPMRDSADFSPRIRDAEMFAAFGQATGPSDLDYWARDLEDQRDYFGVGAIPSFVYGWYDGQFDTNWGDWFPIIPEFVTSGLAVAEQGDPFAPYVIQLAYGTAIPSWADSYVPGYEGTPVEPWVVLDEQGERVYEPDSAGNPSGRLCQAAPFARDYTTHVADRLRAEAGAGGIYLDVFSFAASQLCYDTSHGHAIGGGDYWTQGKIDLVQSLRDSQRASDPDFFVYSEAENEMFLGVTELTYAHNTGDTTEGLLELAPIFQTVYHDYQIAGTVAPVLVPGALVDPLPLLARRTWSARLFFGHAPWAGSVLSPTSLADQMAAYPSYAEALEMVQRTMAVLSQPEVHAQVALGERLRDPPTDAPHVPPALGDTFFPYGMDQPVVYASAWRDPDTCGMGILLQNWTDDVDPLGDVAGGERTVSTTIDPSAYDLPTGPYAITLWTEEGPEEEGLADLSEPWDLVAVVPERSSRFVLLTAADDRCAPQNGGDDAGPDSGAEPDASQPDASTSGTDAAAGEPDAGSPPDASIGGTDAGTDASTPTVGDAGLDEAGEGSQDAGGRDAGPARDGPGSEGGCGCRTHGSAPAGGLWIGLLVLLFAVRTNTSRVRS
ncbi:MAG: hypothetical protein HYY06_09650 [Deltaproteobacteria bacterium]|nr:hypothetical protein [Deltaproteobacteria bacterium]